MNNYFSIGDKMRHHSFKNRRFNLPNRDYLFRRSAIIAAASANDSRNIGELKTELVIYRKIEIFPDGQEQHFN